VIVTGTSQAIGAATVEASCVGLRKLAGIDNDDERKPDS